jgi:hypothetical protein
MLRLASSPNMTLDVRRQTMNDFTKDLGNKLLLLLWEVSTYPDPKDVSSGTRRELAVRVVDSLCGSSSGCEKDLKEIVDQFVSGFAQSPYRDRVERFGSDLMELMTAEHDPVMFLARGRLAQRQHPKRPASRSEIERAKRKCERAKSKCLRGLAKIQNKMETKSSNHASQPTSPSRRG